MHKPRDVAVRKAGIFLYVTHYLLCYSVHQLETAGYSLEETEPLGKLVNKIDILRNHYDELYHKNCKSNDVDYDPRVFRPGGSLEGFAITYKQDGTSQRIPLMLRRTANEQETEQRTQPKLRRRGREHDPS